MNFLCAQPEGRKDWPIIDRQHCFDTFFSHVVERLLLRERSGDRRMNPLEAVMASPGAGKSFFLAKTLEMDPAIVQPTIEALGRSVPAEKKANIAELLDPKNTLVIPITFNSLTPTDDDKDKDGDFALSTRALFWYSGQTSCFDDFSSNVEKEVRGMKFRQTLRRILAAERQRRDVKLVIVAVDELMKATDSDSVIASLGKTLDQDLPVACLVTTLELNPLRKEQTGSGRPINWIQLPPLEVDHVLDRIFLQSKDCKPDWQARKDVLRSLIALCPQHPRIIRHLYEELVKRGGSSITLANPQEFVHLMAARWLPIVDVYVSEVIEALRAMLWKREQGLKQEIPSPRPKPSTYATLIAQGFLAQSLAPLEGDTALFIPSVSALRLLSLIQRNNVIDGSDDKDPRFLLIQRIGRYLLPFQPGDAPWRVHEKMMFALDALRRAVIDKPLDGMPLTELYPGLYNPSSAMLMESATTRIVQLRDIQILDETKDHLPHEIHRPELGYLMSTRHPATDFYFAGTSTGNAKQLLFAVHCKFSISLDSIIRSQLEEIDQASREQARIRLNGAKDVLVIVVVLAHQTIGARLQTSMIPENMIVLGAEHLKQLLGDAFWPYYQVRVSEGKFNSEARNQN